MQHDKHIISLCKHYKGYKDFILEFIILARALFFFVRAISTKILKNDVDCTQEAKLFYIVDSHIFNCQSI